MNTRFQDLQNDNNPRNGTTLADRATVVSLLEALRTVEPPVMVQFIGDNGYNLIVGIAHDSGCVQHAANDGQPPYLMAVSTGDAQDRREMEFLVGDTPTPIDGRYRIGFGELCDIVGEFVATGERSVGASWEEFA